MNSNDPSFTLQSESAVPDPSDPSHAQHSGPGPDGSHSDRPGVLHPGGGQRADPGPVPDNRDL